jgi:hypothetical protein
MLCKSSTKPAKFSSVCGNINYMNPFRTELKVASSPHLHSLNTRFLTLGSCFSEAIGHRLNAMKFTTTVNPFGVIYNPVSIHRVLTYALDEATPPAHTYFCQQEVHLNHDFHSRFAALIRAELEDKISDRIRQVRDRLNQTRIIMLTYGTAWVYLLKGSSHIVANCHKRPSQDFEKRLLTISEIHASFSQLRSRLKTLHPEVQIILTVSPVRHIKDTIPLNSVSKSLLRVACHQITEEYPDVEYFPAYEIMLDDLRDYRFYDKDMIHPSDVAEEYIWERFVERFMDEPAREFIKKWTKIQAALNHRPFHTNSSGHKNFLKEVLNKLQDVQSIVNVDAEIKTIQAQLGPSFHKNIDP